MKLATSLLALLLVSVGAQAGQTQIAQLPLLNVSGSGLVKPNLMLLYDNSGSMASNFTPDFVDDSSSCRSRSLMSSGTMKCLIGHPPFASSDFNKQYYDPKIHYVTPVYADRTHYPSQTAANTSNWTSVTTDGFGINTTDLKNDTSVNATNLVTGFPDLKWCDRYGECVYNSATYSYPNDTYRTASNFTTNAYFYTINVAEWCTTANLTSCVSAAVGAPAPAGRPFPAKVRYCSDTALSNCQAKYVGTYKYPRFGNPNSGMVAAYGTITIGASATSTSLNVSSISVAETGGPVVITNGSVNAPSGTTNATRQAALANALATSIIAKTGLTNQYTACVRTPTGSVPNCSTFGITLGTDNIVAVVPIDCSSQATSKDLGDCSVLVDNTRSGWAISGNSPSIPLATTPLSAGNAVFVRTDIVPGRNYPRDDKRLDCAAATFCTYAEEMTNFANWYAYYKTRNQMMKTAVGLAFDPVTPSFKVGIVSLSTAAAAVRGTIVPPAVFSGTVRTDFYTRLKNMNGSNSTPLRQALDSVGKMYANKDPFDQPAGSEVVKYPCEQNFTFMTTDGYWNGGAPAGVANNDNAASTNRFCSVASGCVDTRGQTAPSLADVALHWYNGGFSTYTANTNSLRPSLEDWTKPGLVPGAATDNKRLHMNTYTLGLGVDGIMAYDSKYDKNPVVGSDFYKLITGATGCPWNNNNAYVWPDPSSEDDSGSAAYQTRVDDLWHAAVNGHGKYFSAGNPNEVIDGLQDALANIESKVGAAAAAATSTPNISQQDNDIFSDTFTTVKWYGELSDKKINTVTGDVIATPVWLSSDRLGRMVGASTDTRNLKMLNTATGSLKNFSYAAMTNLEKSWFDNKCASLPQCLTLSVAQKAILDSGANVVDWLRGQQQYGDDDIMRAYTLTDHNPPGLTSPIPIVLGDIASSKPAFMREPRKSYTLDGYNAFVVANQNRSATVFAAANDGMLHAFNAATGDERWAYLPRITMNKLYKLASIRYGTNHQYTTDGSPEIGDVQINGVWKTILVAGLNGGGRGYYALDVTDPDNPVALWELCADATICTGNNLEPEIGLTFGNPQFGMYQGNWVIFLTSGYNNVSGSDGVAAGAGQAYLFMVDPGTGRVLQKIAVGAADATTPIGFAKISAITNDPARDPVVTYIYGGDNQGGMWRFDLTGTTVGLNKMGDAGASKPITTRPEITTCKVSTTVGGNTTVTSKKIVVFGTGRLLDIVDVSDVSVQSIYALKDTATEVTPLRSSLVQQTLTEIVDNSSANYYKVSANPVNLASSAGWYLDFNLNPGERVNLDPKVVSGSLLVVSNIPSSSSACSVGGSANVYELDVCTGSFMNNSSADHIGNDVVAGQTLSASAAAVGYIVIRLPSGGTRVLTTTATGEIKNNKAPPGRDKGTNRSGWRQIKE